MSVTYVIERVKRKNLLIGANFGCLVTLLMVGFFSGFPYHYWARFDLYHFKFIFNLILIPYKLFT